MSRELPIILHTNERRITDKTLGRIIGHDGAKFAFPVLWPENTCGTCTLCCSILAVHEPTQSGNAIVATAYGDDCTHLLKRRGCAIYADRPDACRHWECLYHAGMLPPHMRPDKVKAVLEVQAPPQDDSLVVHVQPKHRFIWRRDPVRQYLLDVKKSGLPIIVVCGTDRYFIGHPAQFHFIDSQMQNPDGTITPVVDHFEDLR